MPGPGDIHPHLDSGHKPSGQGEPQATPGPLPPTESSSPHPGVQRNPLVGTCGVGDQRGYNIEVRETATEMKTDKKQKDGRKQREGK